MAFDTPCSHKNLAIVAGAFTLFGITLRIIQLMQLWPDVEVTLLNFHVKVRAIQLLPLEILIHKPWLGLLYLQQTPPVPNILYALLLAVFPQSNAIYITLILLQGVMGVASGAALALLLVRTKLPSLFAWMTGLCFTFWSDLILIEYNGFGCLFHENLSMLLCLLTCHAALSVDRNATIKNAATLGILIALLALTRATFSYLWPCVLLWMLVARMPVRPRILIAFLAPLLVLHGGWSLKNYAVHHYWSMGTSTWGGANMLHGIMYRGGGGTFATWLAGQDPICTAPTYSEAMNRSTMNPALYFIFAPMDFDNMQLPTEITRQDSEVAGVLGLKIIWNTAAMRLWSQCAQKQLIRFWLHNPAVMIEGFWKSYQNFWLPIREFVRDFYIPTTITSKQYPATGFHFFDVGWESIKLWNEKIEIRAYAPSKAMRDTAFVRNHRLIAIPVIPALMSVAAAILFHSLPVLIISALVLRNPLPWQRIHIVCLIIIGYVITVTSVVEFSENMRFRLSVEPLIWYLGIETAKGWAHLGAAVYKKFAPVPAHHP